MRYVPINELLQTVFTQVDGAKDKDRLKRAHKRVSETSPEDRKEYIDNNGTSKWSPMKERFTAELGNKCWYTETELIGAPLTIDHYRPKCDYWFLAFNPENFRVACPYANSPKHNEEHGCAGGKGDHFPLINPSNKATDAKSIENEEPIILDPCNQSDCDLIAFLPDGRPVLRPEHKTRPNAKLRVEISKILLNLDHPDFNSQREQLYNRIKDDVATHEELPESSKQKATIRDRLAVMISRTAPFSVAAQHYLRGFRYLDWVSQILEEGQHEIA